MKIKDDHTCPLELVHDMIKGKWKPIILWRLRLGANLKKSEVKENESQTSTDFIQGANSWISVQGNQQDREQASYYGGMTPPDKAHTYELHIFALDKVLDLKRGFYLNELYEKMDGHILEEAVLKGIYEK